MNARTVRHLRPIAAARWELRKWRQIADPERRDRFTHDIDVITRTGEISRLKKGDHR